jgi:hypothetical protein
VEVGLLEVQVQLGALGLGGRQEGAEQLGLEALGDGVVDLDLGVESIDSVPVVSWTCPGTRLIMKLKNLRLAKFE